MNYFTKSRVEAFSDGIFAIIVTLLVLELRLPYIQGEVSSGALLAAIISVAPKLLAFIVSFAVVCVIWVNHHRIFETLEIVDQPTFWLNANLLLWTTLIPFPTAVLGDYPNNKIAAIFFGLVSALMGTGFALLRFYLWRHPDLVMERARRSLRHGFLNAFFFGPVLYVSAALLAFVHPYISFLIYGFVPVYFMLPISSGKSE